MTEDALDNVDWGGLGDDISALFIRYGLTGLGEITTRIGVGEEYDSFSFVTTQDGEWVSL